MIYNDVPSPALPIVCDDVLLPPIYPPNPLLFSDEAVQRIASSVFENREEASVENVGNRIQHIQQVIVLRSQDIDKLNEHVRELKGSKRTKNIFLLSSLIRIFYAWFHRKEIKKDEEQLEVLRQQVDNLSLLLQHLRKKQQDLMEKADNHVSLLINNPLPKVRRENLERIITPFSSLGKDNPTLGSWETISPETLMAFEETCQALLIKETFSFDEIEALFKIEQEMRECLETNPDSVELEQVYTHALLPAYHKAKAFLTRRPFAHSVKLAASQGQALQAGLAGLDQLTAPLQTIRFDEESANRLYLMKDLVAYKKSNRRAKEEAHIITPLFNLRSTLATVPSFTMQWLSRSRYGMPMKWEHYSRGYADTPLLNASLKASIYETLSEQEKKIEAEFAKQYFPISSLNSQRVDWEYLKDGEWQALSLSQLCKLYDQELLEVDCLIKQHGQQPLRLDEHLFTETALGKALQSKPKLPELFFVPDLSDPQLKELYQACEKVKWSLKNSQMQKRKVRFQTLQTLFLSKKKLIDLAVDSQAKLSKAERDFLNSNVNQALKVGWKIAAPEAFQKKVSTSSRITYRSIRDVDAKPFIQEMKIIRELFNNVELLNGILNRLDEESLWNIIVTAELQFLDLHSNNVGLAPRKEGLEDVYHYFKDKRFRLTPATIDTPAHFHSEPSLSFETLYEHYLQGLLSDATWVTYIEDEDLQQNPISFRLDQRQELQALLNRPWQLVFYDLDLNLSEDNELHEQSKLIKSDADPQTTAPAHRSLSPKYRTEHLIPFCSTFLELALKDLPLSDSLLQRLENSTSSDNEMRLWCLRTDAAIRKRVPDQYRNELNARLKPFLDNQHYTLSNYRRKNSEATIKDIRSDFIASFIDLNSIPNQVFWSWMEEALSHGRVLAGDTWDSLAIRYKQSAAKLQEFNEAEALSGPTIRIHSSLCGEDSRSQRKRRKIASQLFPRITWKQYEALVERQNSRTIYLRDYKILKESQSFQAIIEAMHLCLTNGSTPLTSTRKAFYSNLIKKFKLPPSNSTALLDSPPFSELIKLKNSFLTECQPTYFNVMKAMYPLLADAHKLNCYISSNEASAGSKIGWSDFSLEKSIKLAKERYPTTHEAHQLALFIEEKIAIKTDPAYFGKWQ